MMKGKRKEREKRRKKEKKGRKGGICKVPNWWKNIILERGGKNMIIGGKYIPLYILHIYICIREVRWLKFKLLYFGSLKGWRNTVWRAWSYHREGVWLRDLQNVHSTHIRGQGQYYSMYMYILWPPGKKSSNFFPVFELIKSLYEAKFSEKR